MFGTGKSGTERLIRFKFDIVGFNRSKDSIEIFERLKILAK